MMKSEHIVGFTIGWLGGAAFVLTLVLSNPPTTFKSKTVLTPSIELTTDGKTIDTLYVYQTKTK